VKRLAMPRTWRNTTFRSSASRGRSGTIVGMDWMRQWLLLWRVDRIEVISPMSLDEAEAALAASMETRRYGAWRAGPSADSHVITGRIHDRRVRVSANPPGTTNAWNAVLRAELIPLPAGCRLVGRLGWLPKARIFCAFWLTCVVAFFVSGVVLLANSETHGHGTGGYLFMCLVPLAMAAFFVGGVAFFGFIGRKNASFLREWLRRTLRLPESAIPGQDGPIHQSH
jgi:hypothetical protein